MKMWTTVKVGPSDFLPTLMHVHLSAERLVGVVEISSWLP